MPALFFPNPAGQTTTIAFELPTAAQLKIWLLDASGRPQIDSLGHLEREPISEADAEGRFNYRKSDYRNYRDGDKESVFERGERTDREYDGSGSMYVNNETEKLSLINDQVRVYKGGSWKDRAYHMSPGQRRFLNENMATSYIGFRCAMTRVGSPNPGR